MVAAGKDESIFNFAEQLTEQLEAKGLTVLLDDRKDASPGVKFKDAELIGIPYIVIVGKSLQEGKIEFRVRSLGSKVEFATDSAVAEIIAAINN